MTTTYLSLTSTRLQIKGNFYILSTCVDLSAKEIFEENIVLTCFIP
jgi:hypothetical protein